MSSWTTSEYQWTTMESWLPGGVGGGDPIAASTELATRWLRSFGPATAADLQWWTGWTGATTKAALARSGAEEVQLESKVGWVAAGDARRSTPPEPWVALLPALDPTTMGWKERDWYLPSALVPALFDRNGNAGPTIWVDGEIVGGWIQLPTGEIAHRVLADVGRERLHDIEEAIAAFERLIDGARVNVRFPAPLQRELLS